MANELQHRDSETGSTLYVTLRKPDGTSPYWNGSAFEAMTVANWGDYDIAMTETPASSYFYAGTIPAISGNMVAGWYWAEVYKQAGASPAIGDEIRGRYFGYWDGTTFKFWGLSSAETQAAAAAAITAAGLPSGKTGYSLAATGLDAIADPDDLTPATVPTTFTQKLRWLIQRFWKAEKTATTIVVKNEAGQTITTQAITSGGSDQTTGAPS